MRRQQKGFTLIELMIVVAIVGILAAVAVPAYSDYTTRAKVTEGIAAAGAAKTSVADYYYAKGEFPGSSSDAGLGAATDYSTDVIKSMAIAGTGGGVINVVFLDAVTGGKDSTETDRNTLAFVPTASDAGAIKWNCIIPGTNGLYSKYAPANCRDTSAN
ncbi:pilin [Spiribacter vilamensis]|uniref:Type IV pilus assembly protein PilA n=1 Tax=Spiribacter vilamensis TaxID=531306 RepID=A0A4Q8D1K1_9GAMM|nr:pilin [Spiribacter vilamensis]RZU99137.1 type IV pilus assembly protein PilA [Spiribacter vilamensis]TVO61868.1 pilin [Spiribacter vilamensis]